MEFTWPIIQIDINVGLVAILAGKGLSLEVYPLDMLGVGGDCGEVGSRDS